MAFQLPDPPEWWVKYKPLRWVLAVVVLGWIYTTLLPRWREESPLPSVGEEAATAEADGPPPASEPPADVGTEAAAKPPESPAPAEPTTPATKPAEPAPKPDDPMARYTRVEAERVLLINSLRSYESVDAIHSALNAAGFTATVETIERERRSAGDPPFRNDTLKVGEYKHGEFTGLLTLEFFNDRLYQTEFSPQEPADYLGWLRSRGLKLPVKRVGLTKLTAGQLEVTSNIDFASSDVGRTMGSKPFVRWKDVRLSQQVLDAR